MAIATMLINEPAAFLVYYGRIFLLFLLAYEGIKLLTMPSAKLGPVEKKIRSSFANVGTGVGEGLKEGARYALQKSGILGKDIKDIKQDLGVQKDAFRLVLAPYTTLIKDFNTLLQLFNYGTDTRQFKNKIKAIYSRLEIIMDDLQDVITGDASQRTILAKVQGALKNTKTHLVQMIDKEEDAAKKTEYAAILSKIESTIKDEDDVEGSERNFKINLQNLSTEFEERFTEIADAAAVVNNPASTPTQINAQIPIVTKFKTDLSKDITDLNTALTNLKNNLDKIKFY